jgi:ribosomal protein L7Ae-like RNA K-turn-binding protein
MSVKEIKEAMAKDKILFGIKEALKNSKNISGVFVAKDTREETIEKLEKAGIEFVVLKPKMDITRELNLDFECEVFSVKK